MYKILRKEKLNPTVTRMEILAPEVAAKAEPGQFIILRPQADSERIPLTVADFDREKGRISLGYKTEEMNPWYIFTQKYAVGDVATVKIVSLMPFGAFAEIVPGCDGLIHISQIADHKIAKPEDELQVGQEVQAKITAIDEENHKVSLSIRALLEEEAEDAEDSTEEVNGDEE